MSDTFEKFKFFVSWYIYVEKVFDSVVENAMSLPAEVIERDLQIDSGEVKQVEVWSCKLARIRRVLCEFYYDNHEWFFIHHFNSAGLQDVGSPAGPINVYDQEGGLAEMLVDFFKKSKDEIKEDLDVNE